MLLTLLRCISMKRALAADGTDHLNFFRLYDACLMDVSIMSWCKLFGSRNEQLHWTALFPDCDDQQSLKGDLDPAAGGDLDALSTTIRNYRDTYVAHHDLKESKRAKAHPHLSTLQATGQVLYIAVYEALQRRDRTNRLPRPDMITGASLAEIERQWRVIGDAARSATRDLSDSPNQAPALT
ncbi:hypothetical protein [uncultured Amaricoccus sp.]|uniref:hypothetical protein n=1 Tax=uncultured Amaricoccus sp. TaxID=339341 RepID=UPI0026324254|nr:hypothetical protein [uncultured Amaricoccus sp.]